MKSEIRKEIIRLLKEDESFRYEVLGLLGIRDLMDELRKLREDFNRYIRLSERRWRENEKRWRENAKLWEENFKRWEENDRRWKENEKRWEENEKRWEENFKRWENADKTFKWLINALTDIRDALGGGFEYYCGRVVKLLMKERGIDCDIKVNVTLPIDGYKEVDIFCSDPLIVGEVTVTLRSIEEAKNQLEKLNIAVNSAEKFTNKKTYLKVLSVEYSNEKVANYLKEKCKEEGIYLILGREYSLGVPFY
jgi:DNA repair exonuclease SbcCD ATPase subunit